MGIQDNWLKPKPLDKKKNIAPSALHSGPLTLGRCH